MAIKFSPFKFSPRLATLALSALWFALGYAVCFVIVNFQSGLPVLGPDIDLTGSDIRAQKYATFEKGVISTHLNAKLDSQKLLEGCFRGLVEAIGDPYSEYFPKGDKLFEEAVKGSAAGVGVVCDYTHPRCIIKEVMPRGGADKARLRAGDVIMAVDGHDLADLSPKEIVTLLRGQADTKVALTVERDRRTLKVTAVRQLLNPEPLRILKVKRDGRTIAVIRLDEFSLLAAQQWTTEMEKLARQAPDGYVLDLRGNPGGSVLFATELVGTFAGSVVVSLTENRYGQRQPITSDSGLTLPRRPMAILTDGNSASSSEIVAAALRHHGLAVTVGEKTFGKGIGQSVIRLSDGDSVKLTVFRWLSPGGESIDKIGIKPDIEMAPISCASCIEHDAQLDRAVHYVVSL